MEAAQKLARTDNPQTSKDAAEKMVESGELNRQEKIVYEAIKGHYRQRGQCWKPGDFTTKDIAKWISWPQRYNMSYDKAYDICRKRFSDLQMKGKIELVKEWDTTVPLPLRKIYYKRRDGCRVWRLV